MSTQEYARTYAHTHACTHTHARTHARMHAHTHTHTHWRHSGGELSPEQLKLRPILSVQVREPVQKFWNLTRTNISSIVGPFGGFELKCDSGRRREKGRKGGEEGGGRREGREERKEGGIQGAKEREMEEAQSNTFAHETVLYMYMRPGIG